METETQQSKGKCLLCGVELDKGAVSRHLKLCSGSATVKDTAAGKIKAFHILVEGRHLPEYWLHLSVTAGAKLAVLDQFLRRTWLECCGHLSAFKIEKTSYCSQPSPGFGCDERSMNIELRKVLAAGVKFTHDYDFGSTTSLALKVIGEIENKSASVQLLARNNPPAIPCVECGKTATLVCVDCAWEEKGWLCGKCAPKHKCGEDMLLPVVNSPRVGVCGYGGEL